MHTLMSASNDPEGAELFKELFERLVMCKLEVVFSIKTLSKDRSRSEQNNFF